MKIWFVSIFENTPVDDNQNTRYNCLVKEAAARGHDITFWASTFRHNVKKQRYAENTKIDVNQRVTLQFVLSKAYSNNISFQRLVAHRHFSKQLLQSFERSAEKPDLIVVAFPPISIAEKVTQWANKYGIPCVVDIIDPWPDVFKSHLPFIPDFFLNILFSGLRSGVNKTMRSTTAVTAISNQYINWAKSYQSPLEHTRCFYPAVQFKEMQIQLKNASERVSKNPGVFNVIYAGSLGHSYDIKTILKAANVLEHRYGTKIKFTVAGDGPQKELVENYQQEHQNLEYVGRVPKEKLMEYYYLSDAGMTQHIEGATQSVTYKLFDLLACGLPILNSLESEMKEIILDNSVGLHNSPGDHDTLSENIEYMYLNQAEHKKMKENAIQLTRRFGDSEIVYSRALDFLESLTMNTKDVVTPT